MTLGAVVTALALCVGAFVPSVASAQGKTAHAAAPKGSVTVAYSPDGMPNYIFPMIVGASDTVPDLYWFIEQFYRPMYFFGQNGSSGLDNALSMAYPPTFSNAGKTATIKLKGWKWSDGKPITTRDIEFWMNLLKANKSSYANYVPGVFPDNITSIKYTNATTFSITFNKAYNHNWLIANQLSMIFAMPQHVWDKTSAKGVIGNADTTTAGAVAVWKYLNAQSLDVNTYQTNPLWKVVDGPYTMSSYQPGAEVTMVPNANYSGSVKSKLASIKFLNFTSDSAEYLQVLSGNVDYGYVPFADAPGDQRVKDLGYSIDPWSQGGMNYAEYNYSNPAVGSMFKQLYLRQAVQSLVDQPAYIKAALDGYGVPTYGPVPAFTPSVSYGGVPEGDPAQQVNPYPYSIANAKKLLSSHGWKVVAGGVDTCTSPGTGATECGAGVKAGQKLSFQILYPSGVIQYGVELQALASAASQAGVQISLHQNSDSQVFALTALCKAGSTCPWDVGYPFLGGWQYGLPLNYPIGSVVFACGGSFIGGYCSSTADALMAKAEVSNNVKSLYPFEDYLSKNLPVIWLPLQPYQLSAISKTLAGVDPQNTQGLITPEYWSVK
jgi:peptide/nickel transport system substrate-binding protein